MRPWRVRHCRQRGSTLIEVVLALVVFAVGVVAAAQLLVEALAADTRTLQREHAGMLFSDLGESALATAGSAAAYDTGSYGGAPQPQPCINQGGCSTTQLAEHQLASWLQRAAEELPSTREGRAAGNVSAAASDGTHTLQASLQWGERGGATINGASVTVVADPVPAK